MLLGRAFQHVNCLLIDSYCSYREHDVKQVQGFLEGMIENSENIHHIIRGLVIRIGVGRDMLLIDVTKFRI